MRFMNKFLAVFKVKTLFLICRKKNSPMNKELKEFFDNNPGKTLADYYRQRGTDTLTNNRKSESNSNSWEALRH